MLPLPYEIYDAYFPYDKSTYPRPCIILDKPVNGRFSAMPISSAMQLCRGLPGHFTIEDSDLCFAATGLSRTSYADGTEIRELDVSLLIRKRGQFESELLKRYTKWIT